MTVEPIDWGAVEAALETWLGGFTPKQADGSNSILFEDQRVPHPDYPYCSLLLIASAKEGGRDDLLINQDLLRAQNIRVTPVVHDTTLYSITVDTNTASFTSGVGATAAQITAGLKAASSAFPQTMTDNGGTLDIAGTAEFEVSTTTDLSWVNLDLGHEMGMQTTGPRKLTYQITFHVDEDTLRAKGPNSAAMALAETMVSSLSKQTTIDQLFAAGIAIVREQGTRKMDAVVDGQWVSRATTDVQFRVQTSTTEDTGYIAETEVSGTVSGVPVANDLLLP